MNQGKAKIGIVVAGAVIGIALLICGCFFLLRFDSGNPQEQPVSGDIDSDFEEVSSSTDSAEPSEETSKEDKKIIIWAPTTDLGKLMVKYADTHPDFDYEIVDEFNINYAIGIDTDYSTALKNRLAEGGDGPDIYSVYDGQAIPFCQGEASMYAIAYEDLGIDCATAIKEAEIAPYLVDIGTNPNTGKVMGLTYESCAGAFLYRRSIAKEVWGTDDPSVIETKIGPGWEQFMLAAEELKQEGYYIVSTYEDIARPIMGSIDRPLQLSETFNNPGGAEYVTYANEILDKKYEQSYEMWSIEWQEGISKGEVFGYFSPSWLIQYTMISNCGGSAAGEGTYGDWAICCPPENYNWGGNWILVNKNSEHKEIIADIIRWMTLDSSETGLQYKYANGDYEAEGFYRQSVASTVAMRKANGTSDFLGGQNMYDIFCRLNMDSGFDKSEKE